MESAEARPILAAAEAAAAIDDYATAERLLRDAAAVQERSADPDLANTLNNLGVVCERAGKLDDAEASYRRAYEIATSAFPADHPFVATSRQNLEEFCAANGRSIDVESPGGAAPIEGVPAGPVETPPPPIELPGPTTAAAPMRLQLDTPVPAKVGPVEQGPATAQAEPGHAAERVAVAQRVPDRPSRALPLGALAVLVVSFAIVLVGLMAWPRPSNEAPASTDTPPPAPADTAAPPVERSTAPAPARAPAPSAPPAAASRDRVSPKTTAGGLTLTEARLCRTLSTRGPWECTPLDDPATPGTMFFYTRIVAPRPTKVEHRWYFGDRLEQSVTLDIQPNSAGFRTFSRRTSSARHAGQWRVELRSEGGQLLREERFTVSK